MNLISFHASMLREKFVIQDQSKSDPDQMIVMSNRLDIPLLDDSGNLVHNVIIRGKFMHHVLRIAGFVLKEFAARGPFNERKEPIEFDEAWGNILTDYDKKYETDSWVAIFVKGKCLFASTKLHPFLDVIEQCDVKNPDDYDFSVAMAEEAFQQAGRKVKIEYSGTLGMVCTHKPGTGRCGLIFRNPSNTTTFNFMAEDKEEKDATKIKPIHLLMTAADFLEQVQLSFVVGFIDAKIEKELITLTSPEGKKLKMANKRINRLVGSIDAFEKQYDVRYRPEKPNFKYVAKQSQARAKSLLD